MMENETIEFLDNAEVCEEIIVNEVDNPPSDEEDQDECMDEEEEGHYTPSTFISFTKHTDAVYSCHFLNNSNEFIISGAGDDKAYLWNCKTLEIISELQGHTDSIVDTAVSPDNSMVVTACLDGRLRVYDLNSSDAPGTLLHSLEGSEQGFEWVQWHKGGPVVFAGCPDGTSWLFNAKTGQWLQTFLGHSAEVSCGRFSNDWKLCITGSNDCFLRVWAPKTGECLHTIYGHNVGVNSMEIHPNQPLIFSGDGGGVSVLSNYATGKTLLKCHGHTDSVESLCHLRASQNLAVSASLDGTARLWDLSNGLERSIFRHEEGLTKILAHPTNINCIITASIDSSVRLWDIRTALPIRVLLGHEGPVFDCSISSDGTTLVSASEDHVCNVFDILNP